MLAGPASDQRRRIEIGTHLPEDALAVQASDVLVGFAVPFEGSPLKLKRLVTRLTENGPIGNAHALIMLSARGILGIDFAVLSREANDPGSRTRTTTCS